MFERALVRAGIALSYSQGFNPRPRMSLPLPRSVGTLSDDEILCAYVRDGLDERDIGEEISSEFPDGCRVKRASVETGKVKIHPKSANYEIAVRDSAMDEDFFSRFSAVEKAAGGREPLIVKRLSGKKKPVRQVDVSGYINSIKIENNMVLITCLITNSGSVRLDEISGLLGLETEDLAGPVKRTSVQWSRAG